MSTWIMGADGYPTNTDFISLPESNTSPLPKGKWRCSPYYNDGYPYHELLLDIPYITPAPVKQRPYICLYRYDTPQNDFDGHGMFVLTPTSCKITEELNGRYEISMEHPIDAEGRWQYIRENYIIKAMGQLFTIRTVQQQWKGATGKIVAKGDHIFYQLGDRWIKSAETGSETGISSKWVYTLCEQARAHLTGGYFDGDTHYTFYQNVEQGLQVPPAIGAARWAYPTEGMTPVDFFLGSNGVVAASGCEFHRDNFDFYLSTRKQGAIDNAFELRIGKNMTGIKRTIDSSSMLTYVVGYTKFEGVLPYAGTYGVSWTDSILAEYGIPHHIYREKEFKYNVPANYMWDRTHTIVEAMFAEDVELWFSQNKSPLIAYEVDLKDLKYNPDYQMFADLDNLKVGNTGYIHDEYLGDIEIEITKNTVNAITGEVEQVTFGNLRGFVGQPPSQLVIDPETSVVIIQFQVQDAEGAFCYDRNGDMIVEEEGV